MLAVYLGATAIGSRGYRIWVQGRRAKGEHLASAVAAILAGGCAFLPLLAADPHLLSRSYLNRAR